MLDNVLPPNAAPAALAPVAVSADNASSPVPPATASVSGAFPSPFADVIAGTIPAVSIPGLDKHETPNPVQSFVISSLDKLSQAGLDVYEAHNHTTVLYNPAKISEDQIKAADKAGKLHTVAPSALAAPTAAPAPAVAAPDDAQAAPASAPAPEALANAPAPEAKPSATLTRGRLANVGAVKANGIKPNPLPAALSRRAV